MAQIRISYRNAEIRELYQKAGIQTTGSAGFDLVCVQDEVFEKNGEFRLIDLGVVVQVEKGHHSLLLPRSSTFKKFKILQANSVGLVDEDYCGENDFWMMPVIYLGNEKIRIERGTRLCQFVLSKTIAVSSVCEFTPQKESRGGFGSTGV